MQMKVLLTAHLLLCGPAPNRDLGTGDPCSKISEPKMFENHCLYTSKHSSRARSVLLLGELPGRKGISGAGP